MLDQVFEDYINHPEAKSDGNVGVLERKHLEIDKNCIKYIGKESNELEESEVVGVSKEDTLEYVNQQEKLRKIIGNLTLEKVLEIGMSRREFFYLKKKCENNRQITLKEKIMKILLLQSDVHHHKTNQQEKKCKIALINYNRNLKF